MMRKIVLIAGCLVLSVMSLFVFIASLGGLLAEDKELSIAIPLLVVSIVGFLLVFILAKKHIFSCKYDRNTQQDKNKNAINNKKLYTYEDIVRKEVMASNYISPIFKEKVIEFQLSLKEYDRINYKDIDFCNEDKFLSAYEKQVLGLDVGKEYQRSLFLVLTENAPDYGKKNISKSASVCVI